MERNPLRKARKSKPKNVRQYGNLVGRRKLKKDVAIRRKAERLAMMPKGKLKRLAYRLHPKRVAAYVFSKEGATQILKVGGIALAIMFIFMIAVFAYFRKDLPSDINAELAKIKQSTRFYDRSGTHLLYQTSGKENRRIIEFDEMSPYIRNATVALEDKDFYNHGGVSFTGIFRAGVSNVVQGKKSQGGSTITQQFVKNALLSGEKTYTRKVKEIILSLEIERNYNKDQILAFYLNQIPYGGPNEYGIESAAKSFFNKSTKDLTLDEAALLASIPQSPTYFSPYGQNTEALVAKRDRVLDAMADQGYVKREEADEAKKVDTLAKKVPLENKVAEAGDAPHYIREVQTQLEQELGANTVLNGGLKVITTLDWDKQQAAEKAVAENMKFVEPKGDNAALVSEDVQTGQILAYVGSRGYGHPGYGNFDVAQSYRQPGSSIKPFEYAKLFETGKWGPGSVMYDVSTDFGAYKPDNFDKRFRGAMTIRMALAESRNIPAIKSMYIAGQKNVMEFMQKSGQPSFCPDGCTQVGLSMAIGGAEVKLAEHTHSYTTFARGGTYKPQTYVLKVESPTGKVLQEWKDKDGERILDEQVAYNINDILSDNAARTPTFGNANAYFTIPGITTASKTGTTNEARDGWMMGYSTRIMTGVWVGNHDNRNMNSTTHLQTGPIWTSYMKAAHQGMADEKFSRPSGIKEIRIDKTTGYQTDSGENSIVDRFASFYVPRKADRNAKGTIDTVSGKLATECTPPRAKKEVTGAGNIDAEIPSSDPAYGRWLAGVKSRYPNAGGGGGGGIPTEKDDVHKCSDVKPSISLSVDSGSGKMSVSYSGGTHALDVINFLVDGQIVSSQQAGGGSAEFTPAGLSAGSHTFTAQIIDKALYDSEDSKTVNVSGSSGSLNFTAPSAAGQNLNGNYAFKWDGPGNTYRFSIDGDQKCATSSNKQCSVNMNSISSGSHTAQVEIVSGSGAGTVKTITFTKS